MTEFPLSIIADTERRLDALLENLTEVEVDAYSLTDLGGLYARIEYRPTDATRYQRIGIVALHPDALRELRQLNDDVKRMCGWIRERHA